MRIVLPVSRHDIDQFHLLADVMLTKGNLNAHQILISATPPAHVAAFEVAAKLRQICSTVQVAQMETEPDGGWPQAPNMHFSWTLNYMATHGIKDFFFWMEADCVPQVVGWADKLATIHQMGGTPFCGNVVLTPHRDSVTNQIVSVAGDTMMMGCGIYPPGMLQDVTIGPVIQDLAKRPPMHPDGPWDVYLRWVFRGRGITHTDAIADMWNTCNYRKDGESIVCDAAPSRFIGRARSGMVPSGALLVHGCKDDSFHRLILGIEQPAPIAPEPEPIVAPEPESPPELEPVLDEPTKDEDIQEPSEGFTAPCTRADVLAVLAKGSIRVNKLAEVLKVNKDDLAAALPSLGFAAPPPFWVKDTLAIA